MLAVEYSFVFSCGSLLGINLSIVALVMDWGDVTSLGLSILLAALGLCCVSCGGLDIDVAVTCLLSAVEFGCTVFAVVGTLLVTCLLSVV
jgi:hypothetical protein